MSFIQVLIVILFTASLLNVISVSWFVFILLIPFGWFEGLVTEAIVNKLKS